MCGHCVCVSFCGSLEVIGHCVFVCLFVCIRGDLVDISVCVCVCVVIGHCVFVSFCGSLR